MQPIIQNLIWFGTSGLHLEVYLPIDWKTLLWHEYKFGSRVSALVSETGSFLDRDDCGAVMRKSITVITA